MTQGEKFITSRQYEPIGFGRIEHATLRALAADVGWQYGAADVSMSDEGMIEVAFYDDVVSIEHDQKLRTFVGLSLIRAHQNHP